MKYEIIRTDKANDQLYEIINYIADDSGSVQAALHYLNKLEGAILQLEDSLYIGSQPRYSILRRQGYRVLIAEKHLIFCKVDEDALRVIVYAVVDSRREYQNLI